MLIFENHALPTTTSVCVEWTQFAKSTFKMRMHTRTYTPLEQNEMKRNDPMEWFLSNSILWRFKLWCMGVLEVVEHNPSREQRIAIEKHAKRVIRVYVYQAQLVSVVSFERNQKIPSTFSLF